MGHFFLCSSSFAQDSRKIKPGRGNMTSITVPK